MTQIDWAKTPQEKENLFKDATTPKYTDADVLQLIVKFGQDLHKKPHLNITNWWVKNKKQ